MNFNVSEYKFTTERYYQMFILAFGFFFLFLANHELAIIAFLICVAGMFNGNADETNFNYERVVWRYWLKGKALKWFEREYRNKIRQQWWGHSIFWDGWHCLKNMWVLFLLLAVSYSLYFAIINSSMLLQWFDFGLIFGIIIYMSFCSFVWMVGKEIWHQHMARAPFWGYTEKLITTNYHTFDGYVIKELNPNIVEFLDSKRIKKYEI